VIPLLRSLLFIFISAVTFGCEGFTSRDGAQVVTSTTTTTATAATTGASCNLEIYVANVAPIVQSQCITCHGSSGFGTLLLSTAGGDAGNAANYAAFQPFIEATAASSDSTSLMERISSSGSLDHPLKLSVGSTQISAFTDFVQAELSNPTCSASPTPSSGDDNGFF
jgi:hypothetical protein